MLIILLRSKPNNTWTSFLSYYCILPNGQPWSLLSLYMNNLITCTNCWHRDPAPRWAAPALLPSPSPLLQGRRRALSSHTQHTHGFRLELKQGLNEWQMNCLLPLHWAGLYTPIHVPSKVQLYLLHTPKVQGWNQPTTTLVPAIQLVYLYLCYTDTDTRIGIGRIRIRGYVNFLKKPIRGYV